MSKTVAILQSNYIPWKGYFDIIGMSDAFIIYDSVQYTKNDWRNRNKIKTPNGVDWITIPVRINSLSQKINESQIQLQGWNKKHWRTLEGNYAKARCFKEVKPIFEELYLKDLEGETYLSKINFKLIQTICNFLQFKTQLIIDTDLDLGEGKTEKLVDLCKQLDATEYLSGPAAKDYLKVDKFLEENINVKWMDYSGYPEYNQLHPPFEHGVSILDLIFNEGSNAIHFIKSKTAS